VGEHLVADGWLVFLVWKPAVGQVEDMGLGLGWGIGGSGVFGDLGLGSAQQFPTRSTRGPSSGAVGEHLVADSLLVLWVWKLAGGLDCLSTKIQECFYIQLIAHHHVLVLLFELGHKAIVGSTIPTILEAM
jgi:hypothetical protein